MIYDCSQAPRHRRAGIAADLDHQSSGEDDPSPDGVTKD